MVLTLSPSLDSDEGTKITHSLLLAPPSVPPMFVTTNSAPSLCGYRTAGYGLLSAGHQSCENELTIAGRIIDEARVRARDSQVGWDRLRRR